jgi:hypothetical protein
MSDVRPFHNIMQRLLLTRRDVGQVMSIDMLPDDVLLKIFDLFQEEEYEIIDEGIERWQSLVHVCRRWRWVVFGSPRRLNLRLLCSDSEITPARDTLDVWPALPLWIHCDGNYTTKRIDNVVAVLERSDRVRYIDLTDLERSDLQKLSAAMQKPFPKLTHLSLWSDYEAVPVLPDSFFGGSAPRLAFLRLTGILFPGLPKLLLSATHLVTLHLEYIPNEGHISPEAIVTALSTLTRLESLWLQFEFPHSRPDQAHQRPPPPTRSVLPALKNFDFRGVSEYLEIVLTGIDAPRLKGLFVTFFDITFETPQFTRFINRTPISKRLKKAYVVYVVYDGVLMIKLLLETSGDDEN